MKPLTINATQKWLSKLSNTQSADMGKFVIPIHRACPSFFVFDALDELGVNQWHPLTEVCSKTEAIMRSVKHNTINLDFWEVFTNRSIKEDPFNRIERTVTQLKQKYGHRLNSMGWEVSYRTQGHTFLVCLHPLCKEKKGQYTVPELPMDSTYSGYISTLVSRLCAIIAGVIIQLKNSF